MDRSLRSAIVSVLLNTSGFPDFNTSTPTISMSHSLSSLLTQNENYFFNQLLTLLLCLNGQSPTLVNHSCSEILASCCFLRVKTELPPGCSGRESCSTAAGIPVRYGGAASFKEVLGGANGSAMQMTESALLALLGRLACSCPCLLTKVLQMQMLFL